MQAQLIQVKSILSPIKNGPDNYFGIMYNMNLYQGCQHGCIYCDSRSNIYNIGELSHIRIKKDAICLLEKELRKKKKKGTIGTGSMNDPYMPIEKDNKIVSHALEIINKYNYPLHVITKSNLVLRDKEIIKSIGKVYAAVSLTINTIDDKLCKIIEPGAPVSSKRFDALNELSKSGVYSGVIISPVLPFITDNTSNIVSLVRYTKEAGGQYLLAWMGLTQRDGQREYLYEQLKSKFPGLEKKYHNTFRNQYYCPSPRADALYDCLHEECDKLQLPLKMKFYSPPTGPRQLKMFD